MELYSKEGELLKDKFLKEFNKWFYTSGFYGTGDKPLKTPDNPTGKGITKGAAGRAINSLISGPNNLNAANNSKGTNLDYLDNAMSKGLGPKSIMGAIRSRVQNATSGSDGARLAVTPYDALHHQNPLGTYGPSLRMQNGLVRLDFFKRAQDDGFGFSETDTNLKGQSLDPRAHDAGTGGASKTGKQLKQLGERPVRELSAHPRNTNDPIVMPEKVFDSGSEMYDAAKPILEQNKIDTAIGIAADGPRRRFLNDVLAKEGQIPAGVDVFSKDVDTATIAKAQEFLRGRPDLVEGAMKAFDPKEARALIKKLSAASLIGVGMLGTAADAAETGLRTKVATETKDPADALQAAISAAAGTVGATGVGEVLGLPLELINMMIDQHRAGGAKPMGGRFAQKVKERKRAALRSKNK